MFNAITILVTRSALAFALVLGLSLSPAAMGQEFNAAEDVDEGVIQKIDFGLNQMVVSGNRYDVSQSARVEINGSYGAFTMLEAGMRIEFTYRKYSDGVRQIIEVRELADGEELNEA